MPPDILAQWFSGLIHRHSAHLGEVDFCKMLRKAGAKTLQIIAAIVEDAERVVQSHEQTPGEVVLDFTAQNGCTKEHAVIF